MSEGPVRLYVNVLQLSFCWCEFGDKTHQPVAFIIFVRTPS